MLLAASAANLESSRSLAELFATIDTLAMPVSRVTCHILLFLVKGLSDVDRTTLGMRVFGLWDVLAEFTEARGSRSNGLFWV
jgi:hypothetical protein